MFITGVKKSSQGVEHCCELCFANPDSKALPQVLFRRRNISEDAAPVLEKHLLAWSIVIYMYFMIPTSPNNCDLQR